MRAQGWLPYFKLGMAALLALGAPRAAFAITAVAIRTSAPSETVISVPALAPAPSIPATGSFCAALVNEGNGGAQDPNQAPNYMQTDPQFVDDTGGQETSSGGLCMPVSATHIIAGFGDWKALVPGGQVQVAASNFGGYAEIEEEWAIWMGTSATGTPYPLNPASDFNKMLQDSTLGYGSFGPGTSASYSSSSSNATTNTFADPICQGIWYSSTPNSGYDYWKTQFQLQIGYYNISPIKALGVTVGYNITRVSGHALPLSGVWPSAGSIEINNEQLGMAPEWETLGYYSLSLLTTTYFNRIARVDVPGQEDVAQYTFIDSYTTVTLNHGGSCPSGEGNIGGTCQR